MTEQDFNLGHFADLPREFELLLERLPEASRSAARDAIRRALSDLQDIDPRPLGSNLPRPTVRSARMDAIVGRSYDWWVLPNPTLEAIGKALGGAIAIGVSGSGVISGLLSAAAVFQGWMMVCGRTKVTLEQATVLRALRRADKGTGWTLARVVDELPEGSGLGVAEVADIVEDLRSIRTVGGEKPAWSIEENPHAPGHFWTLRV